MKKCSIECSVEQKLNERSECSMFSAPIRALNVEQSSSLNNPRAKGNQLALSRLRSAERLLAQAAPRVPAECVLRAAIDAHMRAANPTGQPPPRLGGGSVAPGCWASESKGK